MALDKACFVASWLVRCGKRVVHFIRHFRIYTCAAALVSPAWRAMLSLPRDSCSMRFWVGRTTGMLFSLTAWWYWAGLQYNTPYHRWKKMYYSESCTTTFCSSFFAKTTKMYMSWSQTKSSGVVFFFSTWPALRCIISVIWSCIQFDLSVSTPRASCNNVHNIHPVLDLSVWDSPSSFRPDSKVH